MIKRIRNLFNQNRLSSTGRDLGYDFIRFFAMMSIVIYHMLTSLHDCKYKAASWLDYIIMHDPLILGPIGVSLFFMLSGALLINKYYTNINITNFYKNRLLRIEAPHIVISIIVFWLWFYKHHYIIFTNFPALFISFLGLGYSHEFWYSINVGVIWLAGAWFTAVIIFLYLLFPLLRYLFVKHIITGTILVSTIFVLNLELEILTYNDGWFSISNGIMCFWLGMLFDKYKHIFSNKKLICIMSLITILYWVINPQYLLKYKCISNLVFSCLLFVSLYQIKFYNKFTQFVCKYNYEIYLVHQKLFLKTIPLLLPQAYNYLQLSGLMLFLTILVFIFSIFLQFIAKKFLTIRRLIYLLLMQFITIILFQTAIVFRIL